MLSFDGHLNSVYELLYLFLEELQIHTWPEIELTVFSYHLYPKTSYWRRSLWFKMRALNKVFKVHTPIDRCSHGTDTLIQIGGASKREMQEKQNIRV